MDTRAVGTGGVDRDRAYTTLIGSGRTDHHGSADGGTLGGNGDGRVDGGELGKETDPLVVRSGARRENTEIVPLESLGLQA